MALQCACAKRGGNAEETLTSECRHGQARKQRSIASALAMRAAAGLECARQNNRTVTLFCSGVEARSQARASARNTTVN